MQPAGLCCNSWVLPVQSSRTRSEVPSGKMRGALPARLGLGTTLPARTSLNVTPGHLTSLNLGPIKGESSHTQYAHEWVGLFRSNSINETDTTRLWLAHPSPTQTGLLGPQSTMTLWPPLFHMLFLPIPIPPTPSSHLPWVFSTQASGQHHFLEETFSTPLARADPPLISPHTLHSIRALPQW